MSADLPTTDPRHITRTPTSVLEARYQLLMQVFTFGSDLAKRDAAMRELTQIKNEMHRRGIIGPCV